MGRNILLMLCYARSGGTLLNRCLGSLPNTVVLSEVNPLGGGSGAAIEAATPYEQALLWYGIDLKSRNFTDSILELADKCKEKSLSLIVRDWTTANFMPIAQNNYQPPYKLLALEALQGKCNVSTFALVRNAIDVFLSQGEAINNFAINYLRYVKVILDLGMPIFKYEDFCKSPQTILEKICTLAGIKSPESFRTFSSFINVNGDIQDKENSRGGRHKEIVILPRKRVLPIKKAKINNCEEIIKANELLGYPTKYEDTLIESVPALFLRKYQALFKKLRASGTSKRG